MANVGIMGAGSWGTALALLLYRNGHQVTVWSISEEEVKMLSEKREHVSKLPGVKIPEDMVFTTDVESALKGSIRESLHRSYTMKVNDYLVNLASIDDVVSLLQAAINKYGGGEKFSVELKHDTLREFSAFTTNIVDNSLREEEEETETTETETETETEKKRLY